MANKEGIIKEIGLNVFIIVCTLSLIFIPRIVCADISHTAHWPVEVTLYWNAVYGVVTGDTTLEKGDSVGMFDKDDNCHGAGLYDGRYYRLSAFKREEANPEITDDFPIDGFMEGEEVVFKAYKESEGKEYVLTPTSGTTYQYEYQGIYPPVRIHLKYEAPEDDPLPPEEPPEDTPGDDTPPEDTPEDKTPSLTPAGVWGLAPEEDEETSSPADDTETPSLAEEEDQDAVLVYEGDVSEPDYERYTESSGSRATKGSSVLGKRPKDIRRGQDEGITTIMSPYSKKAVKKERSPEKKPELPAEKGLPLRMKLLLIFAVPAVATTTALMKLWWF